MLTLVNWQCKVHVYDYGPLEPKGGFSPALRVVCLRKDLAVGRSPVHRVHAGV
jgi:hypothetical protein